MPAVGLWVSEGPPGLERSRFGPAGQVDRRRSEGAGLLRERHAPGAQRLCFRFVAVAVVAFAEAGIQRAPLLRNFRPRLLQMLRFVQGHADGRVEEHGEQQESEKNAAHDDGEGRNHTVGHRPRFQAGVACGLLNALRACCTFDRITRVDQGAIVENKRLGPVLAYIAEKQKELDMSRSAKAPRRRGQRNHMFKVG